MALVRDPLGRARGVKTPLQAARLHLELESELGLNEDAPAGWESQADEALNVLEQRARDEGWGELRDVNVAGEGTKGWSPSLSSGARRGEHGGPSRSPRQRRGTHPRPAPARGGQPPAKRAARASSARRRLAGVRQAAGYADNVPGVTTGRELVGVALWGSLGLVFLYLLIGNQRGPSAVNAAVQSVTNFLMAIVRPVDPLRPHSAAPLTPAQAKAVPLTKLPHLTKTPPVVGPTGRLANYPH